MSELEFLTMAGTTPNHKPGIYLTGLDRDVSRFLPSLSRAVFSILDCAIFYEGSGGHQLTGERKNELTGMQLFAVIVTVGMLQMCPETLDQELAFAAQVHIPILPLAAEPFSDSDYRRHFGNMQYIRTFAHDVTALPFEQQLSNYLASTLISEYEFEHIQNAFEGRMFLSYRKTDRREAQALMESIHDIPMFEPISIWYDEYLTSGKDFRDSILRAIERSQIFLLMITPHILEAENFVMKEEYPAACDAGKCILPIEMVPTNRDELERAYPGLPPVCNWNDRAEMQKRLVDLFHSSVSHTFMERNRKNVERSPEAAMAYRDYFMGLAYLNGVEVEKNPTRAIRLLQDSAEHSYFFAFEKLAEVYSEGIGVTQDEERAAFWLSRLVKFVGNVRNRTKFTANFSARYYFSVLEKFLNQLTRLRRYRDCVPVLREMNRLCENRKALQKEHIVPEKFQIRYHSLYADFENSQRRFQNARMHLSKIRFLMTQEGIDLDEIFPPGERIAFLYRWAGSCTQYQKLDEATASCVECLKLLDRLEKREKTVETLEYRELCCFQLGQVAGYQNRLEDAMEYDQKALTISDLLIREPGSEVYSITRGAILDHLGDSASRLGQTEIAMKYYLMALETAQRVHKKFQLPETGRDLSISLSKWGTCLMSQKKYTEARNALQQSVEQSQKLLRDTPNPGARQDLERIILQLAVLETEAGCPKAARPLFDRSVALADQSVRELGTPEAMSYAEDCYGISADFAEQELRMTDAMALRHKQLALLQKLRRKIGSDFTDQNLKTCYCSLIRISKALGRSYDHYHQKLAALCKDLPAADGKSAGLSGALSLIRKAQSARSFSNAMVFIEKSLCLLEKTEIPQDSALDDLKCYVQLWRECYSVPMEEFEDRLDHHKDHADLMPVLARILHRLIGLEFRLWCITDELKYLHNLAMFFRNLIVMDPEHEACFLLLSMLCWNKLHQLEPENEVYLEGAKLENARFFRALVKSPGKMLMIDFEPLESYFPVEKLLQKIWKRLLPNIFFRRTQ